MSAPYHKCRLIICSLWPRAVFLKIHSSFIFFRQFAYQSVIISASKFCLSSDQPIKVGFCFLSLLSLFLPCSLICSFVLGWSMYTTPTVKRINLLINLFSGTRPRVARTSKYWNDYIRLSRGYVWLNVCWKMSSEVCKTLQDIQENRPRCDLKSVNVIDIWNKITKLTFLFLKVLIHYIKAFELRSPFNSIYTTETKISQGSST